MSKIGNEELSKGFMGNDEVVAIYQGNEVVFAAKEALATPVNVALAGYVLSFDEVENANGYKVYCDNELKSTIATNSITLNAASWWSDLEAGEHVIQIAATDSSGTYRDSKKTTAVSVTKNQEFTITTNLIHTIGSSSNPTKVEYGHSATLNFTAAVGYNLPNAAGVIVEGATSYSWLNGVLVLSNVTNNITITIESTIKQFILSITKDTYSIVVVQRDGMALVDGATIYYGDELTIGAMAQSGYQLDTLQVNGSDFVSGSIHEVEGNVAVTAASSIRKWTITIHKDAGCTIYVNGVAKSGTFEVQNNTAISVSYECISGYYLDLLGIGITESVWSQTTREYSQATYYVTANEEIYCYCAAKVTLLGFDQQSSYATLKASYGGSVALPSSISGESYKTIAKWFNSTNSYTTYYSGKTTTLAPKATIYIYVQTYDLGSSVECSPYAYYDTTRAHVANVSSTIYCHGGVGVDGSAWYGWTKHIPRASSHNGVEIAIDSYNRATMEYIGLTAWSEGKVSYECEDSYCVYKTSSNYWYDA